MNWQQRISITTVLAALAACGGGGGGDPVFNPTHQYGGSPPQGAKVVSPDEFKQAVQDPDFRWESATARRERKKKAEDQFKADQTAVQTLVQTRPGMAKFLLEPDFSDPNVKKLPGDNYLVTFTNKAGQTESVITMGQHAKFRDLLAAHQRFMDVDNQLGVYTEAYGSLPDALKTGLPTPASLSGKGFAEVRAAQQQLEQKLEGQIASLEQQALLAAQQKYARARGLLLPMGSDPLEPPGFPPTPANEERSGEGSDRTGGKCGHASNGLYNNLHWPLKYFITSTKNQRIRGSCTGFALTSATETLVAVRDGKWVNLSEQFLYNRIKTVWDADDYDEGAPTADVAEEFSKSGYRLPFEDQWNYNPSTERAVGSAADEEEDFLGSCIGYDERCSNTAHQSEFICTVSGGQTYCGSRPPSLGQGYKISNSYLIWENGDDLPLNTLRNMLANGRPMVVTLEVTRGMRGNRLDTNGFLVDYDDEVLGGHAIHLVGYLSNSKIQEKLPGAPWGAGGGYFILKNSWGTCYGDGGLVYIPVSWAKEYFVHIIVFSLANPSPVFKNKPPTLQITAPANNTQHNLEFNLVNFKALASDPDGDVPVVNWASDLDGPMGSGADLTYSFKKAGTHTVTATARDNVGKEVSAEVKVKVVDNPPTVEILSPSNNQTLYRDQNYLLEGTASDGPSLLECNKLTWNSSKAGEGPWTGCTPTAKFTTNGARTLTLKAADAGGKIGQDTVNINVTDLPPSGPPDVTITSPKNGTQFSANTNIRLARTITNPGDGPVTEVWKLKVGNTEKVITPKTCEVKINNLPIIYPCFKPADYGYNDNGVKLAQLSLTVTDNESLSDTDTVNISIGFVP